ncbi:MAG: hypothetical protein M1818_008006 [Claussenomyces sp. TS43310]|nr:MAG: hypothetical protein M1818_008006 [Claussenomyces sp. TS43310]
MALGTAEQEVLLKWVNTFPLDFKVESLEDLSDGIVLSKILEDIDPSYIPLTSTTSAPLTPIIDALFRFLRTKCGEVENAKYVPDTAGLNAMKRDGSTEHMNELLTAFLIAAISGPERGRHVQDLVQFDRQTGRIIQEIIERKWDEVKDVASASATGASDADLELEFEARHGALIKQNKDLERERTRLTQLLKDTNNRVERLRDNHDLMQAELGDAKDKLASLSKEGDTTEIIEHLQRRVHEQDTLIDNLEMQCEDNRKEKARMTEQASEYLSQIAKMKPLTLELKDLKQEVSKMDELQQKMVNAENRAANLSRKLESQHDWQVENDQLTQENEDLTTRLRDYERIKRENANLRASQESYTRLVHTQEADIAESTRQRIIVEEKLALAEAAVARLEENKAHDENYIKDMEEERDASGTAKSAYSPTTAAGLNLEEELQEEKSGTRQTLELSRLRAEIRVLKGNEAAVQENGSLRNLLDDTERIKKHITEKYQKLYEEYVIAQQQVTAILNAATGEGSVKGVEAAMLIGKLNMLTPEYYRDVAFRDLRKSYMELQEDFKGSERKRIETEAELESAKRDLLVAQTDLNAVEQDEMEAIELIKTTQETVSASLDSELKALQNRFKNIEIDYDLQRTQLTDALLSKDELQKLSVERAQALTLLRDHKEETQDVDTMIAKMDEKNREVRKAHHSARQYLGGYQLDGRRWGLKRRNKAHLKAIMKAWADPKDPSDSTESPAEVLPAPAASAFVEAPLSFDCSFPPPFANAGSVLHSEVLAELNLLGLGFGNRTDDHDLQDPAAIPLPLSPAHFRHFSSHTLRHAI